MGWVLVSVQPKLGDEVTKEEAMPERLGVLGKGIIYWYDA